MGIYSQLYSLSASLFGGTLGLPIFICLLVHFFLTFGLFVFSITAQPYFWTLIVLLTVTAISPTPALVFCCLLVFLSIICPSHSMWRSWLIKEESENKLSLRKQTSSDLRWLSDVFFQLTEIQIKLHTQEIWTASMLSTMCFYTPCCRNLKSWPVTLVLNTSSMHSFRVNHRVGHKKAPWEDSHIASLLRSTLS